jgi:enoyl-CoA hydratase/carnithine racemase
MHMILTGEVFTAEEAAAAGLVAKVLPDNVVLNTAIEYGTHCHTFKKRGIEIPKFMTLRGSFKNCQLFRSDRCNGQRSRQSR